MKAKAILTTAALLLCYGCGGILTEKNTVFKNKTDISYITHFRYLRYKLLYTQNNEPRLVRIGYRATINAETKETKTTPLYVIEMGDSSFSKWMLFKYRTLGMYGIGAIIWVRDPQSKEWKRVVYIYPNIKYETTGPWYWLLPQPFNELDEKEVEKIDFIIKYGPGGTDAHIKAIDPKAVKTLFQEIEKAHNSDCSGECVYIP